MSLKANLQNPQIAEFLNRNHIAVVATAEKKTAAPHAAVVYYATNSSLEIFFMTKAKTTKSQNLESNPRAALAIYEADTQSTAQINGTVAKVDDEKKFEIAQRLMKRGSKETADTEELPISKLDAGDYVLYKVTPQSIRLGEYKYSAGSIFEVATPSEESLN